jgi:pimeloyl-ACP methyl ester carboxylesterase
VAELTTTDGIRLSYHSRGAGRPILLVPGICTGQRWWNRQTEALASQHRVITFDFRGTGESARTPRGPRVARYAADLHQLLTALDLTDVVLVGWSLGCSVTLSYLDLFGSDRLGQLVLLEGSPKLLNDDDWQLGFADLTAATAMVAALPTSYRDTIGGLVRSMFVDPETEPELDILLAEALDTDPTHTERLLWNHLTQDWRDILAGIGLPTTVVAGGQSGIITPEAARWTARQITGAHLEVFEAAGHALFREQPCRFNELLTAIAASR